MATAAQLQYTLTLPVADKAFFTELLKKTRWTAAPVKSKTRDYTFDDLNDVSKKAFEEAENHANLKGYTSIDSLIADCLK